jgi:hypothetical protein
MQSKCLKSNCTLRLRMAVNHRIALSILRVSSSTFVSNLQERSLIREINAEKRAKNYELMQLPEWHIACTELYRGLSAEKSMRTLQPSRDRLIADKNFCLDEIASLNHAGN